MTVLLFLLLTGALFSSPHPSLFHTGPFRLQKTFCYGPFLAALFYSPCTYVIIVFINLSFAFSAGIPGLVLWCLLFPLVLSTPSRLGQMAAVPESRSAGGFIPPFGLFSYHCLAHGQDGVLNQREVFMLSVGFPSQATFFKLPLYEFN